MPLGRPVGRSDEALFLDRRAEAVQAAAFQLGDEAVAVPRRKVLPLAQPGADVRVGARSQDVVEVFALGSQRGVVRRGSGDQERGSLITRPSTVSSRNVVLQAAPKEMVWWAS